VRLLVRSMLGDRNFSLVRRDAFASQVLYRLSSAFEHNLNAVHAE
jgi:hypothetical protein